MSDRRKMKNVRSFPGTKRIRQTIIKQTKGRNMTNVNSQIYLYDNIYIRGPTS